MTIGQLRELLQRYLTGKATDEDLELVERWFHRTEGKQYRLTDEKREEVAARLLPRLAAITEAGRPVEKGRLFSMSRRMLRIAAIFIVILSSAALIYYYNKPISNVTVVAGNYEIRTVILPDSSRAILKSGSRISYPARYRGKERTVAMQGEVYFDIYKDASKAFLVHSDQMDIRVLGTSFVVSDSTMAAKAVVNVLSGRIGIRHGQEDLGELQAGRELSYDRNTGRASWRYSDGGQSIAWIHKTFSFHETPLESVFAAIENKFGVHFQIRKNKPGDVKLFTGMFSEDDSLKDILTALSLSTGIRYSTVGKDAIEIHYP